MNDLEKKKQQLLFKRGGTCQEERLLQSLVQNDRLIDQKGLDDYLVFSYLYSDLLQYYETHQQPLEGNAWRNFIESDDTTISSLILHTQLHQLREPISNYFLALQGGSKYIAFDNHHFKSLLSTLEEILTLFNYWHDHLSEESILKAEIYNLINHELNGPITTLYTLLQHESSRRHQGAPIPFFQFIEKLWTKNTIWERSLALSDQGLDALSMYQRVKNTLSDLFDTLFTGMTNLQKLAREGYVATLTSATHRPQAGLLIAFFRLLSYATAHLNHVPQRHLDYYYREVLKFTERPIHPDKVYVHFLLKEDHKNLPLPKGLQLSAGKNAAGHDLIFETDTPLIVDHAKINKIHTFRLQTQQGDAQNLLTKIKLDVASYEPSEIYQQQKSLNLFSADTAAQLTTLSPIGFLLASSVLYLKEGKRKIKLGFKFDSESFNTLLQSVQGPEGSSKEVLYTKLSNEFNEAITLQATTEEGWTKVPPSAISTTLQGDESYIEVTLMLMPDIPPIIQYNGAVHGNVGNIEFPSLRLLLHPTSLLAYIVLFKEIAIERITINVDVSDYRGLILQNDLGLIDMSQPFQPFGPFPKKYAGFYIGSDEIFYKDLTDFKINITWMGLPTIDNGFKAHYAAYPGKLTNQDFKINVSYLNHRQWHPFYQENRQKVTLFEVEKKQANTLEILEESRIINEIDFYKLNVPRQLYTLHPPVLTANTLTGFLKFELDGPDMAFGHAIYPAVLAQNTALIEQNKHKKLFNLPTLYQPYTPLIKTLSVDYSAQDQIYVKKANDPANQQSKKRYIKLMPFGYKKEFPNPAPAAMISRTPQQHTGECFLALGIQQAEADMLRLHIQIDESSLDADVDFQPPTWSYLSNNNWIAFKEQEIIADQTQGLTKSGIMVFNLPNTITTDNTLMGTNLVWIRSNFPPQLEALPKVLGVYTQAVCATRRIEGSMATQQPTKLAAYTIQGMVSTYTAIETVTQPFSSFGGQSAESQTGLYTRISERLRHKSRAISSWDYEHMVLEKFPEVFRVKCINHSQKDQPGLAHPGKVMLVVIPTLKGNMEGNNTLPRASKQLLTAIQQTLQSVASPFVSIDVVNPTYEEVKVNVEVKFKKGYEKGVYTNELQKAIRRFLSPWLFNPAEDIRLGNVIPSSKVMDFISKRYYVEAIGNFSILKYTGSDITKITDYDNQLMSTYPWSIMFSSDNHKITVIDQIDPNANLRYGGVGDMSIEDDFIIGPWRSNEAQVWREELPQEVIQESLEAYYLVTKKYINPSIYGHS